MPESSTDGIIYIEQKLTLLLKAGKAEVPAGSLTVKVLLLFLSCRLIFVSSGRHFITQYKVEDKGVFIKASNPIQNVRTLNFASKGHSASIVVSEIHFNTFVFYPRTKKFNFKSEIKTIEGVHQSACLPDEHTKE